MSNSRRRRNRNAKSNNGNGNPNAKNPNSKDPNSNPNSKDPNAKSGNPNAKGGGQNKKKKKGGKNQKRSTPKGPKFDPAVFWGDKELLPEPRGYNVSTDDPTATVRSLGRPPIPGSESAAEHHFALIYERSANLAMALAAAGRLDQEVEDDDESDSE